MSDFVLALRQFWRWLFEVPWNDPTETDTSYHWTFWLVGWTWTIVGLVGGAVVAPSLIEMVGLSDSSYRDELVVGVAVFAGFLVQLLGWFAVALVTASLVRFLPQAMRYLIRYGTPVPDSPADQPQPQPQGYWMPRTVVARSRVIIAF
jgi:hypothetical protein